MVNDAEFLVYVYTGIGWLMTSTVTVEKAMVYAVFQSKLFNEVRIVDREDYCVAHIKNRKLIFPGEAEGLSCEAINEINRELGG